MTTKNKKTSFDGRTLRTMAQLSSLHLGRSEGERLLRQFNETVATIDHLASLDTKKVTGTSQVTGLTNVFRDDRIQPERVFTQDQALSNSKRTHQGYFVVKAVFDDQ